MGWNRVEALQERVAVPYALAIVSDIPRNPTGIVAESTYAEQYAVWHLQNVPRMAAEVKLTTIDMIY